MANVLITRRGLQFVLSAHTNGPLIDVAYFVPVYDDRIDPNVRKNGYQLSSFSEIADENATSPYGEVIWNQTSGYSLSNNNTYIISAASFVTNQMTGSYQRASVVTNLYNGTPLSNQVSASNWGSPTEIGNTGLYSWSASNGIGVIGNNVRPTSSTSDFFRVTDYYPVYDTSAQGRLRGAWKCQVNQKIGKFKFNKIALYARQDGGSSYEFFGESYLSNPVVKTELTNDGFDNIILDLQIDISGVSASWEDTFFSSSADYWSHSPGGLYYPGKIGVGEFIDNANEISATMHLRLPRDSSGGVDTTVPILRMDYDNDRFAYFELDPTPEDFSGTNISGVDILIGRSNVNNFGSSDGEVISLRPKVDSTISLGTYEHSYRELFLWNYANESKNNSNSGTDLNTIIPLNVENTANNYAAKFNNGEVYIGKSDGKTGTSKFSLIVNDNGIDITEGSNEYGSFKGGDLYRSKNDLLIYNTYCGYYNYDADDEQEIGIKDIAILAGVNEIGTYTSVAGQTGLTHKTMYNHFITNGVFNGDNLSNDSKIYIAARGGIKTYGPIEIDTDRKSYSVGLTSYSYDNGMLLTRKTDLILGASVKTIVKYQDINQYSLGNSDFCNLLNGDDEEDSRILLVGKQIFAIGSIYPWLNESSNLGSSSKRFLSFYSKHIDIDFAESVIPTITASTIENYIGGISIQRMINYTSPSSVIYGNTVILPRSNRNYDSRTLVDRIYFGSEESPITYGNIQSLYSNQFYGNSIYVGLDNIQLNSFRTKIFNSSEILTSSIIDLTNSIFKIVYFRINDFIVGKLDFKIVTNNTVGTSLITHFFQIIGSYMEKIDSTQNGNLTNMLITNINTTKSNMNLLVKFESSTPAIIFYISDLLQGGLHSGSVAAGTYYGSEFIMLKLNDAGTSTWND